MELTLKYYHFFGDKEKELGDNLNNPESWDLLRVDDEENNPFIISKKREEWIKVANGNRSLRLRADSIVSILKENDFNKVHSFGVGAAHLEYLIKHNFPECEISCSDFAPQGVARLKKVFEEARDITSFDMLKGDWSGVSKESLCLLYRVDTVFNDEQWSEVLKNMQKAGIKNILFIPSEILTLKKIIYQKTKYFLFKVLRRKTTFSGYVRTKQRFLSLLKNGYSIKKIQNIYDLTGFVLSLKSY